MQEIDNNPFIHRSTITREKDFIGRKKEISVHTNLKRDLGRLLKKE